ncbi:MAG: family 16 glycosylhydrolase [Bacteroidales bacterium]
MSNTLLKTKFSIFSSFGMVPKASSIEEKENNLKKEYDEFIAYRDSDELAHYKELDSFINSPDFERIKKEINAVNYSNSDEYKKEKEYLDLKKSKKIKIYYQVKDSTELKKYNDFTKSDKLANYQELEQFFTSNEFGEFKKSFDQQKAQKLAEIKAKQDQYKEQTKKYQWFFTYKESKEYKQHLSNQDPEVKTTEKFNQFKKLENSKEIIDYQELEKEIQSNDFKNYVSDTKNLKFENTDEYKKQQEYKSLKKSAEIKQYFKFKQSEKLAIYTELNGSETITKYEELEKYISSAEFAEKKKYLLVKDKFKLSDEYKKQQEYFTTKKSDKLKWYQKLEKQNSFDKLMQWELTFEDDFTSSKLDQDKWLTGYYWGKTILNDTYVQANELQFFTEKNIEIKDSILRIITKAEKVNGKAWHPTKGFYTKDFDYTSGLINTGQSFRQQYGRFEAKVRFNHSYPVHHAFWLLGEKITPEIDIFKFDKKSKGKISIANYWGNPIEEKGIKQLKSSVSGSNLTSDFYIYTLIWTPEKLIWKINNTPVFEITDGVPQEPMYILLSSGISKNNAQIQLPCTMEVDWIRVYQETK